MTKKKIKQNLKKYQIHWSATIYGIQTVEAFDEFDAQEQFDSHPNIEDADDSQIDATIDNILEIKK